MAGGLDFGLIGVRAVLRGPAGIQEQGYTSYADFSSGVCGQNLLNIDATSFCQLLRRAAVGGPAAVAFFGIAALCYLIALVADVVACCSPAAECPQRGCCDITRLVGFFAFLIAAVTGLALTNSVATLIDPNARLGAGGILTVLAMVSNVVGLCVQCCRPPPGGGAQQQRGAAGAVPMITLQFPAIAEWAGKAAQPPPPPPPTLPGAALPPPVFTLAAAPGGPCPYWRHVTNGQVQCACEERAFPPPAARHPLKKRAPPPSHTSPCHSF